MTVFKRLSRFWSWLTTPTRARCAKCGAAASDLHRVNDASGWGGESYLCPRCEE